MELMIHYSSTTHFTLILLMLRLQKIKCDPIESFSILLVGENSHVLTVYFNELVANILHDIIGILIFELRGHGGC